MSEVTPSVETQAAEDTTSQADTPTEQTPAAETPKDELVPKSELNKKNSENQALRIRAKKAEEALQKIQDAELSETQRLQKQLEEATGRTSQYESTVKNLLLQSKVNEAAAAHGARSARAIAKLIDMDSIEFDLENLTVSGVDEEVKRLKKEDPDLFRVGGTDGGKSANGRDASFNMNDLIRGSAGRR